MNDQIPDNRRKSATRFKMEFVDRNGNVVWDVLVTEPPPHEVRRMLWHPTSPLKVRRPIVKNDPDRHAVFSPLDPDSSIRAAREAHERRATKRTAVLVHLLDRDGIWVDRETIRQVGGDSGDRRVRELRQDGWPIEIAQQTERRAWACRMNLMRGDHGAQPMGT